MMIYNHPFHLVTNSPWPLFCSFSLMIFMISLLKFFSDFVLNLFFLSLNLMIFILFQWWRDIVRESTYQGFHSIKVKYGMILGMILFILSEFMFFLSFFWSYFHNFLSPSVEIGSFWPSKNLILFNSYNIPLLNTLILLSSGVTITWCHYMIYKNNINMSLILLYLTLMLGGMFSFFQYIEYKESFFSLSDSIYGSLFFMVTGFHGLHVILGSLFILVSMIRMYNNHFSNYHYFGFEASSWYWHFVDIVWLFLYIFFYWFIS